MAAVDRILSGCIPCYGMMKKAMPGPEKKSRKNYENRRLTEVDPKTKKPRLKAGVSTERAVEVLYIFSYPQPLP